MNEVDNQPICFTKKKKKKKPLKKKWKKRRRLDFLATKPPKLGKE